MEVKVYNSKGQETRKIELPESIFGITLKNDLIHQVVHSILANKRRPIAHAKGRDEVRGGGIKPWRQKGTGRARHGSIRSPIWKGGGVSHGPKKERNFSKKINRKMRKLALFSLLSDKNRRGEILFVDKLEMTEPKARGAKEILGSLSKVEGFGNLLQRRKNSAILSLPEKDINTEKSFRNFGNVVILESRNLNAANVINYKHLVFVGPEKSIEMIAGKPDFPVSEKVKTPKKTEKKKAGEGKRTKKIQIKKEAVKKLKDKKAKS